MSLLLGEVQVDVISTRSRLLLESAKGFQLGMEHRTGHSALFSSTTLSSASLLI